MTKDTAYREAEKKIAEALKSGATELDLSDMELTELPEALGRLTQLQELILAGNEIETLQKPLWKLIQLKILDLSNNRLTTLPEALEPFTQLKELDLSNNELITLPGSFGQLTQLTSLDLSSNGLTALPDSLSQLTQLQELNLSSNGLTTLPDSLSQLTQLTLLNLSNNGLTALPESLSQLTQLTELNLSRNQLTTLPNSLGQLTQLRSLDLTDNRLISLPESIGNLTQVTELNLSNSQLTKLPESLGQLTQLRSLDLTGNRLISLPESIGNLIQLENLVFELSPSFTLPISVNKLEKIQKLNFSRKELKTLPRTISNFTQLIELDFSNNLLTELPESLGQLTSLQFLNLSNNQLTKLPESLGQLANLITLDVSDNQLLNLPESLGNLARLQSLNFSRNLLVVLPESLVKFKQLRSIGLSGNPLKALPELFDATNLQTLDICDTSITTLPMSLSKFAQLQIRFIQGKRSYYKYLGASDHFTIFISKDQEEILTFITIHFTHLKSLDISDIQLKALPESIGQLTQLQSLDIHKNELTTLPQTIGQLTELQSLNLYANRLDSLPDSLGQIKQLQVLNLSANRLTSLPESIGKLVSLQKLDLGNNLLESLPESIGKLSQLPSLNLSFNKLTSLPNSLGQLTSLKSIDIQNNLLTKLPESFVQLSQLRHIIASDNQLITLPESLGQCINLQMLFLSRNKLIDLPSSIVRLENLEEIKLRNNPLNLELTEAYKQGIEGIKAYLRAKAEGQITINEAKLILVGEGEVGKTCLMDALLDKEWQEHPSTHGIEIQSFNANDPETGKEITLNGWDFGGQRVYRPTHQLFFSAPAVYLVVWKPREGPQQGFVKEWIQLVKRREPSAKIIVVATHGGPQQRQPDIDRQELWDLFGVETVVDFFFVDSKPDAQGHRKGIAELKQAIAHVAAELPEVGRSVPKSFADVRAALQATGAPYLPLDEVLAICHTHNMDDEIARFFITISHRLGHLTHYENDPALRDIVILRPDWLATAMSYVLDDETTRKSHGLVDFSRLGHLWDDPTRPADTRYPATLHRIFLRLMERFDLSYRVAGLSKDEETNPISLIAQLVPDTTPRAEKYNNAWGPEPAQGDIQQTQICRIVDAQNSQSANAEGLFYQLIVRLHKFSLGRTHWDNSVHWQRGLILDADYNGRALLRHIDNDVHITVRAAYPQGFLTALTDEVRFLVESFWEGLRCEITVPCLNPTPCKGLFEVSKLIENKKQKRHEQPCSVCNYWQNIDQLLSNAPAATQPISIEILEREFASIKNQLGEINTNTSRILSQIDKNYADLLHILTDEAKEGPRLFSLFPLERSKFNPKSWIRENFRLVLWCEHSRLPLPILNNGEMKKGVYEIELEREWFKKAGPYIKFLSGTLSMVLPVATSAVKLALDDDAYKAIEEQLAFGKSVMDAAIGETAKIGEFMGVSDKTNLEHGIATRADGATLRELHTLLKAKGPGFGGLVRVMNKRQEFLWVHEKFASEY